MSLTISYWITISFNNSPSSLPWWMRTSYVIRIFGAVAVEWRGAGCYACMGLVVDFGGASRLSVVLGGGGASLLFVMCQRVDFRRVVALVGFRRFVGVGG